MKNLFKVLFTVCLMVGLLGSCKEEEGPLQPNNPDNPPVENPVEDPVPLATPQPQAIVNDIELSIRVFWPEVEHAIHYMVCLNEEEPIQCETTTTTLTNLTPGDYTIKVQAIAEEGSGYLDSEWGEVPATIAEPSNTFKITFGHLDAISCSMTCTPSDLEALYVFNTLPKSEYDAYASDNEFIEALIEDWKTLCANYGISLEKGLEQITSTGVDEWAISGAEPDTDYIVYAFGLTPQGEVTTPLTVVPFRTLPMPEKEIVELIDVQQTQFTIKVNSSGYTWRFAFVETLKFKISGYSDKEYLATFGTVPTNGDQTITWRNGEELGDGIYANIYPSGQFTILAAFCNEEGGGLSPVTRIDFRTLPSPPAAGSASIDITNIQSFWADITITPSAEIVHYYVYVRVKSWYDQIISYGAEYLLPEMVKKQGGYNNSDSSDDHLYSGSHTLTEAELMTYMNPQCQFYADTDYYIGIVLVDANGNEKYIEQFFKTLPM